MSRKPHLRLHTIKKTFGRHVALHEVSLDLYDGEFVCFLGPSGCGKTTLLRIIAGLEEPDTGHVFHAGLDITRLSPAKRGFGIVFQSYALFPNLTAAQNIAYGLQSRRVPRHERNRRVADLLHMIGLPDVGPKYPAQLSGGQQQRIAVARALALSPQLLLLDEPLSALDAQVRGALRAEIARLHRRLGVTTIMVTHDQTEALTLADRVVVMNEGRIVQVGTPEDVYQHPVTPFVAGFVGQMNFLDGIVEPGGRHVRCGPEGASFVLELPATLESGAVNSAVTVAIRPEAIQPLAVLSDDGFVDLSLEKNVLRGRIEEVEFLGAFRRVRLRLETTACTTPADAEGPLLLADIAPGTALDLKVGEVLAVSLPPSDLRLFPREGAHTVSSLPVPISPTGVSATAAASGA